MGVSPYGVLSPVEIIKESEKAFLVEIDGDWESQIWLPKSQIAPDDLPPLKRGLKGLSISVTYWWAEKNNLELE